MIVFQRKYQLLIKDCETVKNTKKESKYLIIYRSRENFKVSRHKIFCPALTQASIQNPPSGG